MSQLTTEEAKSLITMLKRYVDEKVLGFPSPGNRINFEVTGETSRDIFSVNIYRQRVNTEGCTFQGRTTADNTILMRLDVNPTAVHVNPDGEKIEGTHLHIYTEDYDERYATRFDTEDKDLFEICFTFFKKFNIIESEKILHFQYSIE